MTRGKLIYIFGKDRGISSVEFNGDMYPSGHGDEIIEAFEIRRFESAVAFRDYVERFDRRHFGYAEEGCEIIRDFCLKEDHVLDISGNITDYLYIMNDAKTDCYLKSGEQITCIPIGAMAIVHYKDVQRILEKPKQQEMREPLVSREVFTEVIARIKVGREINYQIARICRENARYLNCDIEDFAKLIQPNDLTLIKLLGILMLDKNGEIEHFISELEFERYIQDGSAWNKRFYCDIDKLYDYLSTKSRGQTMSEDNVGYQNIDMEKTGKRIQELSMRAGYSVKDIQKFLHLSCPQPVYRWMKGSILPSVNHLYMLSRLFRVHMEELLVVGNGWEQLDYSETAKMRYQRISGYWSRIVAA